MKHLFDHKIHLSPINLLPQADCFHLPPSQRQMKREKYLCVLCAFAVNIFGIT